MLGVSRSSVSRWIGDVELTAGQQEALRSRNPRYNAQRNGANANRERAHLRRRAYQLAGRRRARGREPLFVAGCMLYWAEGDKARGKVRLSNSDPELIRFFGRFLRECFGLGDDDIRVACHLFADHVARQCEVEQFWLDVLLLPRSSLRTSSVNAYSRASQRKRVNRLPYGTCNVIVHSTEVVQTIFGGIQELAGFNRRAWLG